MPIITKSMFDQPVQDFFPMRKGSRFLKFQVLQQLDSTHQGMTDLYVVKNQQKAITVCKAINKKYFQDQKSIEHIKSQKESLLHFTKQNVLGVNKIIDTFQDEKRLYIQLEMVEGIPLHKIMQLTGPIHEDFTRLIVTQVGLIMKNFHNEGYIYRDIKASNFMVNRKGKVTMIDLGHAKRIDNGRTFTICGTTHAMPPQVYEGQGYSYEFDYYSFGVLIFQLLTWKSPFGYEEYSQDYYKKIKAGLTEQHLERIKCPVTRDLIMKLMRVNPSQRLGSKKGFDQILEHDYFNIPQFCDYKDILEADGEMDQNNKTFQYYAQEIEQFGLQFEKYDEIKPDDPFYKFYG